MLSDINALEYLPGQVPGWRRTEDIGDCECDQPNAIGADVLKLENPGLALCAKGSSGKGTRPLIVRIDIENSANR